MNSRPSGDDVLVRRAARDLAVQAAGLVAGAMLLLVVLVTLVVVRGQQQAADRSLRTTAASADDVGDPPASSWILIDAAGQVSASAGLPADLTGSLAALRRHSAPEPALATLSAADGDPVRVVTQQRHGATVQVVLDLRPQHQDRDRLLTVMSGAAGLSLLLAVGLGALLGRRAVRPLAHALALQRTFVADASHELRTPLTLLSTRVQVLDRQLSAASRDRQVLRDSSAVVADVQRLGEVVEDLLVAADPRRDEQHERVDLAALLRDIAAGAAPHAAGTGVSVVTDLPGQGDPLPTRGSAPALRRAVLALVDNAVDHTPDGGEVRIRGRRQGRRVVVAVSDTGSGMDPAAAGGFRRRFHSGDQLAGRAHYGLGLALTHDVADRHGGQLRLVPAERGTTFELVLPADDP